MTEQELLKEYALTIKGIKGEELERIHQYYLGYVRGIYDAKQWDDETFYRVRREMSKLHGLAKGVK